MPSVSPTSGDAAILGYRDNAHNGIYIATLSIAGL
jgi:hypothetical protein